LRTIARAGALCAPCVERDETRLARRALIMEVCVVVVASMADTNERKLVSMCVTARGEASTCADRAGAESRPRGGETSKPPSRAAGMVGECDGFILCHYAYTEAICEISTS
jgi:hypothetical protein